MPNGDTVAPARLYAQEQASLDDKLDFNTIAMFGIAHGFDAGVTVYNLDFERRDGRVRLDANHHDRREPYGPLLVFVAQYRLKLLGPTALTAGAQAGPSIGPLSTTQIAWRGYLNVDLKIHEDDKCAAGAYVANNTFLGEARVNVAPWVGCEIDIVEDLIELEADWDMGKHGAAGFAIGPEFRLGKDLGLATALRIPNPWLEERRYAVLVQLEYNPPSDD